MFKPQFAPLVKSGAKRQTIRPLPKRMPEAGDRESWREWIDKPYRSKQRELAKVTLTNVEPISINCVSFHFPNRVFKGDTGLMPKYLEDAFAKADGFENAEAMREWFKNTHGDKTFSGILIEAK